MTKKENKYSIKLKSYDIALLEGVVESVIKTLKAENIDVSGSIPLPTKREVLTVLRSPFVHKPSMEQFERRTHVRLIIVKSETNDFLNKLKSINVPSAVEVEIK